MKVNIVSGPFVFNVMEVKLEPIDKTKTVIVQVNDFTDLSKQVRDVGATTVTTLGYKIYFREGM
jgi:hypothetical protein